MIQLDRCASQKPARETAAERQARRRARRAERLGVNHGRDTAAATNASNCPDLALPKGVSRDTEDAAAARAESRQIQKTRRKLWALTSHCEVCGDSERETAEKWHIAIHQMHEDPSRAMTRGLPPEQRFSIYICGRVCDCCHQKLTNKVLAVHFHDEVKRWRGDYDVIDPKSGEIIRAMRREESARPRALFQESIS